MAVRIGIAILIIAGLAGAGFYYFKPVSAGMVMGQMMDRMSELQTVKYSGIIQGNVTAPELMSLVSPPGASNSSQVAGTTDSALRFEFSGSSSLADLNNPNSEAAFTVQFQNFILGLEGRRVGENFFFKLTQEPKLGLFDLSIYKNIWIKVTQSDISQIQGADSDSLSELNPEQKQRLKTAFAQHRPFQIEQAEANDSVDGKPARRYVYKMDKAEIRSLVLAIHEITNPQPMSATDVDELDQAMKGLIFTDGEIWIGQNDYYLYKITGGISTTSDVTTKGAGDVTWEIKLHDFNVPLSIIEPAQYKTLDEVMSQFLAPQTDTLVPVE